MAVPDQAAGFVDPDRSFDGFVEYMFMLSGTATD